MIQDMAVSELIGIDDEKFSRVEKFHPALVPVNIDEVDTSSDLEDYYIPQERLMQTVSVDTGLGFVPVMVELIAMPVSEPPQTPVQIGKGDLVEYTKEDSTIPRQHRVRCNPFSDRNTGKPMVYLGYGNGFPALVERLTLVEKAGPPQPAKVSTYRRRYRRAA